MTVNQEALKKLTIARSQLLLNSGEAFWGVLALRLQLVEDASKRTLAVDGKRMFYNPEFINTLSPNLVRSAVAHEVQHCVFQHIGRRGNRNPVKWNQAGDYVINQDLEDAGFEIGDNWLINPAYKGMNADQVYNLLPDPPEDGSDDSLCDVMDGDSDDRDIQEVEWKLSAVQAATAAKARGKLPGSLERFIEEITSEKVDWKAMLRAFVTQTSKDDYSWMRLNKRFLAAGLYIPSLYSENMGNIVVCIDTSGSITQDVLNMFGAEIKSIISAVRPEQTHVIYCDAEVNHVDEFGPYDDMQFKLHGGGGTDFRPPFAYLEERDIKPACFIYLTDGYGPFPDNAEFPVMWAMTTDVKAPFGETIYIGD